MSPSSLPERNSNNDARMDAESTSPELAQPDVAAPEASDDGQPKRDEIQVGAGGKLIVPREDIGDVLDDGSDLDLVALRKKRLRKPHRREWFALNLASEYPVALLIHKPKVDGIEVEHYYIAPELRSPIRDELKSVRVFVYFSFKTNEYALWPVNVTPDNSWYESIVPLFNQPTEFFGANEIRVVPDRANAYYRVKYRPMRSDVKWPEKSTGELLGEALGEDRLIANADHELYQELIAGVELR